MNFLWFSIPSWSDWDIQRMLSTHGSQPWAGLEDHILSAGHGCLLLAFSVWCLFILRGSRCSACSIFDPFLPDTMSVGHSRGDLLSGCPQLCNIGQGEKILLFLTKRAIIEPCNYVIEMHFLFCHHISLLVCQPIRSE